MVVNNLMPVPSQSNLANLNVGLGILSILWVLICFSSQQTVFTGSEERIAEALQCFIGIF